MAYKLRISDLITELPESLIRAIRPMGDPAVSLSHARIRTRAIDLLHKRYGQPPGNAPPTGFDT